MFSCLVIFFSLAKESKKVVEVRWSQARNSAHNPKWIKYVRRQNICKRFILEMESVFTLFTLPPPQFANYYSLLQRKISIVVLVWPRPSLLNVFFFISFMCDLLWKAQTCVVLLNVFLAASSNALMLSFLSIYCFYTSFNQHRFPSLDTVYFVFPPLTILFSSASSMLLFITIVAVDFVLFI